jgi:hypothetical protein
VLLGPESSEERASERVPFVGDDLEQSRPLVRDYF